MTKFHVGDKVRVVGDTARTDHEANPDLVYTVTQVWGEEYYVESDGDDDDFSWGVGEADLRPADIVPFPDPAVPLNDGVDLSGQIMSDSVNHPSHYTAYKGIEVIQLTEQMNFNRGNAVKYIARAGLKDPSKEIEDLRKGAWYICREIARLEAQR